jgi:hypothetical protein
MGKSDAPNSYCLNSSIPRLWPFATGRGFLKREIERFGLGWWRGDRIIESRKPRLRRILNETGFAYVAPLRNSEATKCREILETIGCPFVVHLWDILDERLNADYEWLFSHAEHVFCLSEAMTEEIRKSAPCETSPLAFIRPQSNYQAKCIDGDTLVIGLVGFLSSYREGMQLLSQAVGDLRHQFKDLRLRYVGPPGQLEFIPDGLKDITEYIGFPDDLGRDEALAECHVGYLPGPFLSPRQDLRSRYSIPSRSADYLAIGLPLIAAANIHSATSNFFSPIRGRGYFPVSDSKDICLIAKKLRDQSFWAEAAQGCVNFFNSHFNQEEEVNKLFSIAKPFL